MNLYKDKLIILTNLLNKLESKEEKLNLLNLTIKKYLCGKISPKYTIKKIFFEKDLFLDLQ